MSCNMFGVIVSGHLVQANFQQVTQNNYLTTLPSVENVNHIVVFLTGSQPFPDGSGGSVYFSLPNINGASDWHLLGTITNEKPSSIFKISSLKPNSGALLTSSFGSQNSQQAQIGISVQPLFEITSLTPATGVEVSSVASHAEFSSKMCENLYNFAASFAQQPNQIVPVPNELYLPLSAITKWFENFKRKLQHNPNFWKN